MQITFQSGTRTCTNCEQTRSGGFVVAMGTEVVGLCEECLPILATTTARAVRKRAAQKERDLTFGL